jgi:uncharacterized protein (TIGR02301 family)
VQTVPPELSSRTLLRAAALALALIAAVPAVEAQTAPVYRPDLVRLSELLGTISYLDGLCGNADAARWRGELARLFDAQGLDEAARRPYVAAYNRGLRSVVVAHRTCGPEARAVLDRFIDEGAALAADIDRRFGIGGSTAGQSLPLR